MKSRILCILSIFFIISGYSANTNCSMKEKYRKTRERIEINEVLEKNILNTLEYLNDPNNSKYKEKNNNTIEIN